MSNECSVCGIGEYLPSGRCDHCDCAQPQVENDAIRFADEIVEAFRKHDKALADYFAEYGAEHSDEDCPQDDTCSCPLNVAMHETEATLRLAIQNYRDARR